jgi:hypothetical protein
MKRSIFLIVLLGLVLGFGSGPGCTSFVWDPTGVWTFIYFDFSEEVTFSGSCEEGIISNWAGDDYDPQTYSPSPSPHQRIHPIPCPEMPILLRIPMKRILQFKPTK